jgi:hypothetical protein
MNSNNERQIYLVAAFLNLSDEDLITENESEKITCVNLNDFLENIDVSQSTYYIRIYGSVAENINTAVQQVEEFITEEGFKLEQIKVLSIKESEIAEDVKLNDIPKPYEYDFIYKLAPLFEANSLKEEDVKKFTDFLSEFYHYNFANE